VTDASLETVPIAELDDIEVLMHIALCPYEIDEGGHPNAFPTAEIPCKRSCDKDASNGAN
jgi:hypothetical protein